jgi:hypothetical protein
MKLIVELPPLPSVLPQDISPNVIVGRTLQVRQTGQPSRDLKLDLSDAVIELNVNGDGALHLELVNEIQGRVGGFEQAGRRLNLGQPIPAAKLGELVVRAT